MTRQRPDLDVSARELDYPVLPLDWLALFGNHGPVELEVGPGKGLFLVSAATARPLHNFVGVEISRKYARLAAERVTKHGLDNVRLVTGDAARFVSEFVPAGSLHAVHVYFPDPWWKQRHKKRRIFQEPFVAAMAHALSANGTFYFATDVREYFDIVRDVMLLQAEFTPIARDESSPPDDGHQFMTNFERKYRKEGRSIYRAAYRRT